MAPGYAHGLPEAYFAHSAAGLARLREADRQREAWAEFCDATLVGDRRRLEALHRRAARADVRSRMWLPVECFLDVAGLPLPAMPTQWSDR